MSRAKDDLMNRLVRGLDRFIRWRLGIYEIAGDAQCIFRLGRKRARYSFTLPDGVRVSTGEPVAMLHLWGDRVPALPPEGADIEWANRTMRLTRHSLRVVAREMQSNPLLANAVALGNDASMAYTTASMNLLKRLGFVQVDPAEQGRLEPVILRINRGWSRLLRRAYNAPSLRSASTPEFDIRPMWISRASLLERHGGSPDTTPSPQAATPRDGRAG